MQELGIPSFGIFRINGKSGFFGTSGLINSGITESWDFIARFFPTWAGTFGIPGAFPHFSPFPQGFRGIFIPEELRIPDLGFEGKFGMGEKRF